MSRIAAKIERKLGSDLLVTLVTIAIDSSGDSKQAPYIRIAMPGLKLGAIRMMRRLTCSRSKQLASLSLVAKEGRESLQPSSPSARKGTLRKQLFLNSPHHKRVTSACRNTLR